MGRARMFGARLWARMPPEYLAALKAFAFQSNVPLAEYVRDMVHDHILQRGAAFRERGAALRALVNAGEAWEWRFSSSGPLVRTHTQNRSSIYDARTSLPTHTDGCPNSLGVI